MKQVVLALLMFQWLCCSCQENKTQDIQTKGHTSLGTPVPPTTTEKKRNSLGYLEQHIGKRPSDAKLWESEPLQTRLRELLGAHYDLFRMLMQQAELLQQEQVLYTIGRSAGNTTHDFAVLLIDLELDRLQVFISGTSGLNQYSTNGEKLFIPQEVQQLLQQTTSDK